MQSLLHLHMDEEANKACNVLEHWYKFSTLIKGNWRLLAIDYLDPPYNLSLSKPSPLLWSQKIPVMQIQGFSQHQLLRKTTYTCLKKWVRPKSPCPHPRHAQFGYKIIIALSQMCLFISLRKKEKNSPIWLPKILFLWNIPYPWWWWKQNVKVPNGDFKCSKWPWHGLPCSQADRSLSKIIFYLSVEYLTICY